MRLSGERTALNLALSGIKEDDLFREMWNKVSCGTEVEHYESCLHARGLGGICAGVQMGLGL